MANTKISALTSATTPLAGTETLPIVQSGATVKATVANITGAGAYPGAFTTLSATGVTTVQAGTALLPAITTTGNTNTGIYFPAADTIAFTEGGAEAMRILSTGDVGIGTATPVAQLGVFGTGQTTAAMSTSSGVGGTLYVRDSGTGAGNGGAVMFGANAGAFAAIKGLLTNGGTNTTGDLAFSTRNAVADAALTERARLDASGGNLLVGTTSANAGFTTGSKSIVLNNTYGAAYAIVINQNSANNGYFLGFGRNGSQCGYIWTNALNSTQYVTSSDYRLKENIVPMTGALAKVSALKPVTYTWKEDGASSQGFIAHELQEVVPEAVAGEKDALNEDGSIKPQGIDTSFLVATLTAAIQEQQALIISLTARLDAANL
jgi:hypothetical protein